MRSIIFLFALPLLLAWSCSGRSDRATTQIPAGETVQVITVHDLLQDPVKYVDQPVAIGGTVTHVCKHAGKRLHLTDISEGENIRVEAGESIVRFERELEGSNIVAYGILRSTAPGNTAHAGDHHHDEDGDMEEEADCVSSETVSYWLDGQRFEVEKEI